MAKKQQQKEYKGDEGPGLLALPFMFLLAPVVIAAKVAGAILCPDEKEEPKPEKPKRW